MNYLCESSRPLNGETPNPDRQNGHLRRQMEHEQPSIRREILYLELDRRLIVDRLNLLRGRGISTAFLEERIRLNLSAMNERLTHLKDGSTNDL
jgi:hypothetical protein